MPRLLKPSEFEQLRQQYKVGPSNFSQYFERVGSDIYLKDNVTAPGDVQRAVDLFKKATGSLPSSQSDVQAIYDFLNPTPQNLVDIQQQKATAKQQLMSYKPSTFTTFVKAALALKAKPAQEKLGVSSQYEKAGIPINMATLSGALNLRSTELGNAIDRFNTTLETLSGVYKDQYNTALENYKLVKDDFDSLIGRARDLEDQKTKIEQELDLYKRKAEIDKETYLFEQEHKRYAPTGGGGGITTTPETKLSNAQKQVLSAYNFLNANENTQLKFLQLTPNERQKWYAQFLADEEKQGMSLDAYQHFIDWLTGNIGKISGLENTIEEEIINPFK